MSGAGLPDRPSADDFRALARSSPWRFTTLHFTHRRHAAGGNGTGEPVEAWLDRRAGRVTVRHSRGVEVSEGVPYGVSTLRVVGPGASFEPDPSAARGQPMRRPDGLVAARPDNWHVYEGDPMWRDYQWTAMLDPAELSSGVDIDDVTVTTRAGRLSWGATCRPLVGEGDAWDGGYDPRCGCCPLLDSVASRLVEYGPSDPMIAVGSLPTTYRVLLDLDTGIVVEIAALDGSTAGTVLTNDIHAADQPLYPP